jgi:hypothetical protein
MINKFNEKYIVLKKCKTTQSLKTNASKEVVSGVQFKEDMKFLIVFSIKQNLDIKYKKIL